MLSLSIMTSAAALALSLQSPSEPVATPDEAARLADKDPASKGQQTLKARVFVLEYPIHISPYVADYTSCLRSQNVEIGAGSTFESEHKKAVPLCMAAETKNKQSAIQVLEDRPRLGMNKEDLDELFTSIQMTHINRGRVMDGFLDRGLDSDPYEEQVGRSEAKEIELNTAQTGSTTR